MKKFILYMSILTFLFTIIFGLFAYKLTIEAKSYSQVISKLENLNDTYYLCIGLLKENPSLQRIDDCKYIKTQIDEEIAEIKQNHPFILFYQSLFRAK